MPRPDTTARVVLRPGHSPDISIQIDGLELKGSTRAVTIRGEVNTTPTIELDMYAEGDIDVHGRLTLSEFTVQLLVQMGWTPPPDDTGGE